MAAELSVKDGGTWRTIPALYVNNGASWLPINAAWVKQSGTWQLFYGDNSGSTSYTTPGTYSFTVPAGVFSILVTGCGGAGPGGGGDGGANYNGPGAGGGGANLISGAYSVTPGQVLTVTVGAAGTPPSFNAQTGTNGIPSTVSGTGVSFATGAGTAGAGYYAGRAVGIGANGANNGSIPGGGTSTNGGANGGSGGGREQGGNPGDNGRVVINYRTTTYTSGSGTFTVPSGIFKLIVQAAGGGGGGGFSAVDNNDTNCGGGGGGGSNLVSSTIDVTPGQSFSYSVGAGGAAQTANTFSGGPSPKGTDGGTSTVSGVVTSYGGTGGYQGGGSGGATWYIEGVGGAGGSGANAGGNAGVLAAGAAGTSTNGGVSGGQGGQGWNDVNPPINNPTPATAGQNGFVRFIY